MFFNKSGNCLAIVADGMGGHNAGEVASSIAVTGLQNMWLETEGPETPDMAEKWLLDNVTAVNEKIFEHS